MGITLAACANLDGTFEVTPFLRESITGDTWRACLAREYQAQARLEVRAGRHWAEATSLANKGRAALASPEPVSHASCECATAEARHETLVMQIERGAGTTAIRKSLDEAQAACAAPR